jgi:nitrite reductase/ring-hydroxylating ferredoxin subunit
MTEENWIDVGATDELAKKPVQELRVGAKRIALTFKDGRFGAISGVCNHVGGPLGSGRLDGDALWSAAGARPISWIPGPSLRGYDRDRG